MPHLNHMLIYRIFTFKIHFIDSVGKDSFRKCNFRVTFSLNYEFNSDIHFKNIKLEYFVGYGIFLPFLPHINNSPIKKGNCQFVECFSLLGCHNKIQRLDGLNRNIYSRSSGGWKIQDEGTNGFGSWREHSTLFAEGHLPCHCVPDGGVGALVSLLLIRAPVP